MAASIGEIFGALGQLMAVCPCCSELFYVSEAHAYYEGQKPRFSLDDLSKSRLGMVILASDWSNRRSRIDDRSNRTHPRQSG